VLGYELAEVFLCPLELLSEHREAD